MTVNMRAHGHGQGYTDINFLIPETLERIEFVKGPYHAELGDFSSAGGAHIKTFERIPGNQVRLGVGENGYARLLAMGGRISAACIFPARWKGKAMMVPGLT